MALAAPPDLSDTDVPVQPLARTYPRGLFIEPHEHAWGQLLYAMSGVMWVETPNEALVVPPQRAVWLPPGVPHGIRVVTDLQMRNIYLRPSLAATLDSQVQVLQVDNLLRELIVRLVEQAGAPQPEYYDALVGLALLELKRARRSQLKIVLPDRSDRRLISLCQAVMAAPSLDIPFERHAEAAGASVRTLARLFKDGLGMGFAEWRRQVQLATAAAELIQGVPVGTIARELGYSPGSFSDMFRRELGLAPVAIRGRRSPRLSACHPCSRCRALRGCDRLRSRRKA
ncbi:Transcriptional regulator, AraC family [Pseudomonas chlororaphis]|uniref:Transcriptional regulator, AraC family n=1 Tax=Pseudomonas chlororaphis TaxID=587753 RepID=A0A3G7TPG1_9PSED|nr:helix-turn-helix transcriptional regulator [Pseudomonas chlororaphis]AZE48149.1 Transcriptional regulator, AraC family [Pseudomonas chlororaphis]